MSTETRPEEEQAATQSAEAAELPEAPAGGGESPGAAPVPRRRGLGAVLALLVALAALGAAGWNWWDARSQFAQVRQDLAHRLAEIEGGAREAKEEAGRSLDNLRQTESRLGVLESKIAESQSQQLALEALYQDLSRNRDETALAEAEQYLTIAAQQLQLAGDSRAALVALEHADSRLAALDRPQLKGLREKIAGDMDALRSLPYVDVSGMSLRLDRMIADVDRLPLASDARAESATAAPSSALDPSQPLWKRWLRQVWTEVKELVRIQRLDRPEPPLLEPSQAWFLRENLRLRLLSARLALLHRDQGVFRGDLQAARQWISRYFDASAKPAAELLAAIDELSATQIRVEMPDLSPTLEAARNFKLPREKVAP